MKILYCHNVLFIISFRKNTHICTIVLRIKKIVMTINEAQEIVDRWINTTGIRYFNELTNMAILTEEVGEVARIISRKYGEQF